MNQLSYPSGLYVDDDLTVYIANHDNESIVEWKYGATSGQVIAGGNGRGRQINQFIGPIDVVIDQEKDSVIICDKWNERVVRWPRRNGKKGETIISNIFCGGLTIDDPGFLYVSDEKKYDVKRWRVGDTQETVVAGGHGKGNRLDQLNETSYVFLDRDHSVYVSDLNNHLVMKWVEGATEGIVVAGGRGQGNNLTQLSRPQGVVVDELGTIYVADCGNGRITRWPKGATQGSILVSGNRNIRQEPKEADSLYAPVGLSSDRYGNLYVADWGKNRVQNFKIDPSCC